MPKDISKDSFVRWQSIVIGQMTYAVNLILSFSIATLGFQVTLLLDDEKFKLVSWQGRIFILATIFLIVSIVIGLLLVLNRLVDFNITKDIARRRETRTSDPEIQSLRVKAEKLGKISWCLLCWQIGAFGGGIIFTALSVLISVWPQIRRLACAVS